MRLLLLLVLNVVCVQPICVFLKRYAYNESCTADSQCYDPMICLNGRCACDANDCYFFKNQSCILSRLCDSLTNRNFLTVTLNNTSHSFRNFATHNNTYYVSDHRNNRIMIYNRTWHYQRMVSFSPNPWFILYIGSSFYLTTQSGGIRQTSLNFTVQKTYNAANFSNGFRSMFYDETTQVIYIANQDDYSVQTFDLDLNNLAGKFTSTDGGPHGVFLHEQNLYVSTSVGKIIKVRNFTKISSFQTLCHSFITQITIDEAGVIAVPCDLSNTIMLYLTDGTYLNKSVTFQPGPLYANFNLDRKLVFLTHY